MQSVLAALILFLQIGLPNMGYSQSGVLVLNDKYDGLALGRYLSTSYDAERKFSFAEIQNRGDLFTRQNTNRVRHPRGDGVMWSFVDLHNPTSTDIAITLTNRVYLTESTNFFIPEGNGRYQEHERSFYKRYYGASNPQRFASITWKVPPGTHRVFIKQKNLAINRVNLKISDPQIYHSKEITYLVLHIFLFGLSICLILIKFVQFLAHPERSSLFYCLSAGSVVFNVFVLSNYWRYLLTIENIEKTLILPLIAGALSVAIILPLEFTMSYLKLNEIMPRFCRVIRFFSFSIGIPIAACSAYYPNYILFWGGVCILASYFSCFLISLWRSKWSLVARYLSIAWGLMHVSFLWSLLGSYNFIEQTIFNQVAVSLAIPIENLIIFFGLSRINKEAMELRQKEINRLDFSLKERIQTLKNIASGVAHEINNPLSIVMGNLELIQRAVNSTELEEKTSKSLITSIKSVERVTEIIQGLLVYSQDKSSSSKTTIPIEKILLKAIAVRHNRLSAMNYQIETSSWERQATYIIVNPLELTEAFCRIIDNAIDATFDLEHPRIKITIRNTLEFTTVSISDNGPGINNEVEKMLFDPFITTKQDQGAVGLGLSNARSLIERQGGTLVFHEVTDSVEKTCFTISLPTAAQD